MPKLIYSLIIYANSSPEIGGGHVYRQIALAQAAFQLGFKVTFVYHYTTAKLLTRVEKESFPYIDLNDTSLSHLFEDRNKTAIVIDDYAPSDILINEINELKLTFIFFDDLVCDIKGKPHIVVNPSEHLTQSTYKNGDKKTKYLTGHKYRLIRQEFLKKRENDKQGNRILISLGAYDSYALTYPLVEKLLSTKSSLPLDIVLSETVSLQPYIELINKNQASQCKLHQSVENMASLMSEAALAITTASGTLFELAVMGVPAIALSLNKNQEASLSNFDKNKGYLGFFLSPKQRTAKARNTPINLEPILQETLTLWRTPEKLMQMSQKQTQYIDGLGSQRIIQAIKETIIENE